MSSKPCNNHRIRHVLECWHHLWNFKTFGSWKCPLKEKLFHRWCPMVNPCKARKSGSWWLYIIEALCDLPWWNFLVGKHCDEGWRLSWWRSIPWCQIMVLCDQGLNVPFCHSKTVKECDCTSQNSTTEHPLSMSECTFCIIFQL